MPNHEARGNLKIIDGTVVCRACGKKIPWKQSIRTCMKQGKHKTNYFCADCWSKPVLVYQPTYKYPPGKKGITGGIIRENKI